MRHGNIQYQHRSILDPTPTDLDDMGALGFQIVSTSSYMGMQTVYFTRPRPCFRCGGTQKSSDPVWTWCAHCLDTDGAEPLPSQLVVDPHVRESLAGNESK